MNQNGPNGDDQRSELTRRRLLQSSAAAATVPGIASASGLASSGGSSDSTGSRRTNGDPNAPARMITAGRDNPIPEHAIRNKREALLRQFDTRKRAILQRNPVPDGEQLLAYGLRLEDGVPVEYTYAIPSDAGTPAFETATKRAHAKARRFNRGEL